MGIVVSLLNHKGGVGKTTSAINIGAGLVELGKRVLLIDLDPQANLTISLGIPRQKSTIYEALRGESELTAYTHKPNLDIVTSSLDLSGAEMELINEAGREFILRELLSQVTDDYDYILIDSPPSLGLLTVNALTAARDGVLIPVQCEYLPLEGLTQLTQTIQLVQEYLNPSLRIRGVMMTMYDGRTNLSRQVVEEVRQHFPNKVFKTIIPRNIRLSEAPSFGQPINVYAPQSPGALAYKLLTAELLNGDRRNGGSEHGR